jgi:DNA-binding transcriptional MerR regulator
MKGPEAFRTISEAAEEIGVPQHVLRFWETKFSFIRPMKRAGGRRFYRPQDLAMLKGVRVLLHDEGYTIKGVQRLHKELGVKRLLTAASGQPAEAAPGPAVEDMQTPVQTFPQRGPHDLSEPERLRLSAALQDLLAAKSRLRRLLDRG